MMRHPDETPEEPLLFDLPLVPERVERQPERKRAERRPREERPPALLDESPALPLREPANLRPVPSGKQLLESPEEPEPLMQEDVDDDRPSIASRFAAGIADLVVHTAILVVALVGSRQMGVRPILADWPAFALFLLSFSFLYMVVPLAFWGHTLGMAWAGLTSRGLDGEPLTFDQTVRRWLGGLLTLLTLGLPTLVAGRRRNLTDLLSGSETLRPTAEPADALPEAS
ncbi:MAG TPA: RDD family protein [Thermoanaerobaculia bacterium]|nr:RDD family protein [Thermoanaerobaculia bacterium]